ncbi:hypothetical protein [Microbacterium invictum]|uniref:Uncharacterized protein n=1 Tax=Microbacterium invictum TaxID=515415 RepID=A0ABZ0VFE7_9MICO|nr:hypothetical protein [Microbacterium invictum]WQB71255.1 hypothetical protein T9R20_04605 [Microbacterium invictum]
MAHPFYSAWMVRKGSLGWATHEASFAHRSILAHVQLSSYALQDGERFQSFRRQYAYAYIETINTPTGPYGIPLPNKDTDSFVWLDTDHLTFQLQADGPQSVSAFGLIHDLDARAADRATVLDSQDFAVYDEDGTVVGSHQSVRLDGGQQLDTDRIQERVLERAKTVTDRGVDIVPVDLSGFASGAEYRIDPRTHRPAPPRE